MALSPAPRVLPTAVVRPGERGGELQPLGLLGSLWCCLSPGARLLPFLPWERCSSVARWLLLHQQQVLLARGLRTSLQPKCSVRVTSCCSTREERDVLCHLTHLCRDRDPFSRENPTTETCSLPTLTELPFWMAVFRLSKPESTVQVFPRQSSVAVKAQLDGALTASTSFPNMVKSSLKSD